MTPEYVLKTAGVPYDHGSIDWAESYAEPGYTSEKHGIYFADWNDKRTGRGDTLTIDKTMSRLAAILETMGASIEWSDEWITCDCGKAFRTQGNSYGWTMHGYLGDGDYQCGECVKEDPEEYLELITNNPRRANTLLDLSKHGYTPHKGEFESGLHPGQNDNPEEIAKTLPKDLDFIFGIDGVGQFDISFSIYTRPKN